MKFDMEVPGIKIQLKFDFGICRSKVKVHSSLNISLSMWSSVR